MVLIQFTATEGLLRTLEHNKIKPEDYKPAYNGESVGLDLFNASKKEIVIEPFLQYVSREDVGLPSHMDWNAATLIPTGIKVALPPHSAGLILQRGSIKKTPLLPRAGVVDPGWTGETFIQVINFSSYKYVIAPYSKTPFQLVVVPCITQFAFIDEATYNTTTRHAQRKEGCIGSSDKQ